MCDFVVPSKQKNAFVVKEAGEGLEQEAEVLVCLQEEVLARLANKKFPEDFSLELLPDLSVVIEELSHFNTFCQKAVLDRGISSLELEVQAEVDKFGIALDWLEKRNEAHLRDQVFDTLLGECVLGDWVEPQHESRYRDAHEIARNFCRRVLEKNLQGADLHQELQKFFNLSKDHKLSSKF